jgi:hypothetical protein
VAASAGRARRDLRDALQVRGDPASLTENFLKAGKFFKRGGKWVGAGNWPVEGVAAGIKELGL